MRADQALERLGGVADVAALLRHTSRAGLRRAMRRGRIVRDVRGRYSLPGLDEARRVANRVNGVLAEDSAAQVYGWKLKHPPPSPCVMVPRNRKLTPERREGARVRYRDVDPSRVRVGCTDPVDTVMWCAARMPFDEALAIADSALRCHDVTVEELREVALRMPDRYRERCLRVARHADGRAANPFESVLRSIALEIPGLHVVPQAWISKIGQPDLADEQLRLVLEADSFEWHGNRFALRKDCERYNAFVVGGWLVLRFTWEHVMLQPEYVRRVLIAAVALLDRQPQRRALEASRAARSA